MYTLPFAGLGLLAIAKATGESIRIPRELVAARDPARAAQHHRLERAGPVRRPADAGRTQRDPRLHDAGMGNARVADGAPRAAVAAQGRRPGARHGRHAGPAGRRLDRDRGKPVRRADDSRRGDRLGHRHGAVAQVQAADPAEHADRLDDDRRLGADRDRSTRARSGLARRKSRTCRRRRGSRSSTTSCSRARLRTGRGSRWRVRCRSRCRRSRRCPCRSSACSQG